MHKLPWMHRPQPISPLSYLSALITKLTSHASPCSQSPSPTNPSFFSPGSLFYNGLQSPPLNYCPIPAVFLAPSSGSLFSLSVPSLPNSPSSFFPQTVTVFPLYSDTQYHKEGEVTGALAPGPNQREEEVQKSSSCSARIAIAVLAAVQPLMLPHARQQGAQASSYVSADTSPHPTPCSKQTIFSSSFLVHKHEPQSCFPSLSVPYPQASCPDAVSSSFSLQRLLRTEVTLPLPSDKELSIPAAAQSCNCRDSLAQSRIQTGRTSMEFSNLIAAKDFTTFILLFFTGNVGRLS